jgi:hypothetical protein
LKFSVSIYQWYHKLSHPIPSPPYRPTIRSIPNTQPTQPNPEEDPVTAAAAIKATKTKKTQGGGGETLAANY